MIVRRIAGLVVAAALAVAAVGCSSDDGGGGTTPRHSSESFPPPSAYDLILRQIGPDGTVSAQTALAAFSLAIAPLPGAPGPTGPAAPIVSGTAAVRWALAHWADFSAPQRSAVLAALTGADPTNKPAAFQPLKRAPESPDLPCLSADSDRAAPLRPALDSAITQIAAKLGRTLTIPVRLSMNDTQQADGDSGPTRMYTYPCRNGKPLASGRADGCSIHINPLAMTNQYTDRDREIFLIHEAMHCYLIDKFGYSYLTVPDWLAEGIPIFVQADLGRGDERTRYWWHVYLDLDHTSLFKRAYDALGYYVQLANSGVAMWSKLDAMVTGFLSGGNAGAWKAGTPGEPFLRAWAPGHARGDRDGADWDIAGYGIPAYWPDMKRFDSLGAGASASASAPVAGVDLIHVVLPGDSVVTVGGDQAARGLLGLADGDHPLPDVMGRSLCTKPGGCACPDGGNSAGAGLPVVGAGPGYLGVTGGLVATSVTLTVTSLSEFCARPAVGCVVGDWVLTNADLQAGSGATAVHETGGAGMRMTIAADGKTAIDFSPMQPVQFTGSNGLAGQFRYDGSVAYQLGLPPAAATSGEMAYLGGDLSKLTVTARITKPFDYLIFDHSSVLGLARDFGAAGGVSLDTQPLASRHSFTCTGSTLVLRPPAGGTLSGAWNFARA